MVALSLEGRDRQHSHMNSGSVTFSVIHSFHTLSEQVMEARGLFLPDVVADCL